MKTMPISKLPSTDAKLRELLVRESEIVVTRRGKPFALLTPIDDLNEARDLVAALRPARCAV